MHLTSRQCYLLGSMLSPLFHPIKPGVLATPVCATHCCTHIDNLGVIAGGRVLLSEVSLHLHCGELLAVVGPNGGGKSTFLKALIGEIPYHGRISFLDPQGGVHHEPRFGYVPQNPRFESGIPVTVLDLFAAALTRFPTWLGVPQSVRSRTKELLAHVAADELLDRRVGALSGGELQRVLLALALEPKPNLLLLDEPVSGMDANGRKLFYQVLDQVRRTHDLSVILVSHDFRDLGRIADRLVLLQGTVLCSGKPNQVYSHPSFVEIFGSVEP